MIDYIKTRLNTMSEKQLGRTSWLFIIAGVILSFATDGWEWTLASMALILVGWVLALAATRRAWADYKAEKERYDKALEEHRARRNNGTWTEDQL